MEGINAWLVGGGLVVGAVFGVLVQRFRFCMVAATGNWLLVKDNRLVLAFLSVWIVAIGGTVYLEWSEWIEIDKSAYRNSQFDWLGVILGGVLFGIGATLAGGCATRTLVRSMEGSLHAWLALISFMVVAAITQFGYLEPVRLGLTAMTAVTLQTDAGLASVFSLSGILVATVVILGLLAFLVFLVQQGGMHGSMIIVGAIIGALVVFSWIVTGDLAQDEFDPRSPSAMTMSGPLARFGYMLTGRVPALSFAIAFVIGTAFASLLSALVTREFKIIPIQKGMAKFSLLGGALMGIGGILAYGCNIGQGLSGMSTLSIESLLATLSMFVGAVIGVKFWEKQS